MEVADIGNLDHLDLVRAVQKGADAFRKMGIKEDTAVRIIINQGRWSDETLKFREIAKRDWENNGA